MNAKTRKRVADAFAADKSRWHNTEFYGIIKPRENGEFTLDVYAANKTKTYGLRITEVCRAWSDRPYYLAKDVWRSMWGGLSVEWNEARNRPYQQGQWYNGKWGRKIFWDKSGGYWYAPYVKHVNLEALAQTKYKYCGFKSYDGPLSLVEYTTLWKRYPGVEMLSKAGLSAFVSRHMCAKLEKDKAFAGYLKSNATAIAGGGNQGRPFRPQVVVRAYANNWPLEKAWRKERVRYCYSKAPKGIDRDALDKYLEKHDIDMYDYLDYCKDVKAAKEDILAFGVTFPRDFHNARVKMQKRIAAAQRKEDMERNSALRKAAEQINLVLERMGKRLAWRVGDFSVIVPVSRADFRKEADRMRNCISGYYERCADGETLCFFVNYKGKRAADVEVNPRSGRVLQCRAKRNQPVDDTIKTFAETVGREYAKIARKGRKTKAA